MLIRTAFALFLGLAAALAYGQDAIVLRNNTSGEEKRFITGTRVSYSTFEEGDYFSGVIASVLDTSVVIGKDTVSFRQLASIRKRNTAHKIARVVGIPLMGIGAILLGDGIVTLVHDSDPKKGSNLILTGIGLFALGYLPYYFERSEYTCGLGGEWTLTLFKQGKSK